MPVITKKLALETNGNCDMVNITKEVSDKLSETEVSHGIVTIFVPGATGALTTIEYEPGLVKDLPELFDKLVPPGRYHHDETWHDNNGHSHLRASLLGPSLTVPFRSKNLMLGTWQQIVFIDFDTRSRRRELVLQFVGE